MKLRDGQIALGSIGFSTYIGKFNEEKQTLDEIQAIVINNQNNLLILPPLHPALLCNKITNEDMPISIEIERFLFMVDVELLKQGDDLKNNYLGTVSKLDLSPSKNLR